MKKVITLFAYLCCILLIPVTQTKAQSSVQPGLTPQFMTDITIEQNTLANQRHVRIASAFNGWMFAAFIVNDTVSHKGGVVVSYSRNGGINWLPFNGYPYFDHSWYTGCDITVEGVDTALLNVFVGDVRRDLISNKYEVEVQRYEAIHIAFPPTQVYFKQLDSNKVYDMALTSDYRQPSVSPPVDTVYTVGLLYNHHGFGMDTMIFATTESKSKYKFGKGRVVDTEAHLRNLALSYSYSATANKGTYNAAWESLDTTTSTFGHILTSRSTMRVDSAWLKPTYLDSLNPSFINMLRSPSIACQNSNTDNDSSNATAAISFDYARNGFADSLDLYAYVNNRADSTNFWSLLALAVTNHNELQSNLAYDAKNNQFLITYYDSTAGGLVYMTDSVSHLLPVNLVNTQYNDLTTNLKAPWPRVVSNPSTKGAFFAWAIESSTAEGVIKCDGTYLFTSTGPILQLDGMKVFNPYPNPATSAVILPVFSDLAAELKITLVDVLGQPVWSEMKSVPAGGLMNIDLDVAAYAAGVYFCRIETATASHTLRLVVQH